MPHSGTLIAIARPARMPAKLLPSNKGIVVPEKNQPSASRLGLTLFFLYAIFYFGFVLVNAFAATWAEWKPIAGLNLAILWGFALIGVACILSLIYGLFSVDDAAPADEPQAEEDK